MQEDINHLRNVRYSDSQQIIGGHCAQVPLSSLLSAAISAFIDHCLRKHVCDWNALIKECGQLFALPSVSVGGWNWFWILNWVIYYQGPPSIYNLKAGPAASVAGLLIGVFTGPGGGGSSVPLPLNACQRVWSFHHQRWYTPLWGAKNQPSTGFRCRYGSIDVAPVRLREVRQNWLPCFCKEDSCPTSGASCDVVEGGDGSGGGGLTMRGMCATLVSVYLKDANHPDPLWALMGRV